MSNDKARLWFGFLTCGPDPSIVVFDRHRPRGDTVQLFHLKRDDVVEYVPAVLRQHLRRLHTDETSAAYAAGERYLERFAGHKLLALGQAAYWPADMLDLWEGDYDGDDDPGAPDINYKEDGEQP